ICSPLSEKDRERLSRRFTVDFNYNSNHIEGNTYGGRIAFRTPDYSTMEFDTALFIATGKYGFLTVDVFPGLKNRSCPVGDWDVLLLSYLTFWFKVTAMTVMSSGTVSISFKVICFPFWEIPIFFPVRTSYAFTAFMPALTGGMTNEE